MNGGQGARTQGKGETFKIGASYTLSLSLAAPTTATAAAAAAAAATTTAGTADELVYDSSGGDVVSGVVQILLSLFSMHAHIHTHTHTHTHTTRSLSHSLALSL